MNSRIQIQYNVSSNTLIGDLSIKQILNEIKNGGDNLTKILRARKEGKGTPEYTRIKEKQLPSFIFNFTFADNTLWNDNIIQSTGLMYLDIDGFESYKELTSIKEELQSIPFIYAIWESLSQTGLGILIKVDGLTKDNYDYYKTYILNEYGYYSWDKNAFKKTQKTVLSYDEDLYLNEDAIALSYDDVSDYSDKVSLVPNITSIKERVFGTNDTFQDEHYTLKPQYINRKKLKMSTEPNFNTDEQYIIHEDKVPVNRIMINKNKIGEGHTNTMLSLMAVKVVDINDIQEDQIPLLIHTLKDLNRKGFKKQLSEPEITKIAYGAFKRKGEHKYQLDLKKVTFNSYAEMSVEEKMIIGREAGRKGKKDATFQKLIEHYTPAITQKELAEATGKGIATVKRHWKELKNTINMMEEAIADTNTTIDDTSIQEPLKVVYNDYEEELIIYINPEILYKPFVNFSRVTRYLEAA